MKYRSLDILACPQCGAALKLKPQEVKTLPENEKLQSRSPMCSTCAWAEVDQQNLNQCMKCFSHEVLSGVLECPNGHSYPIINGVPRMLVDAMAEIQTNTAGEQSETGQKLDDDFLHTQRSFSSEWQAVSDSDTAWGKDIEYRKNLFLQGFDIQESELDGKILFDGGCGHGEVELGILESGVEIFAIDLSLYVDKLQDRLYALGKKGVMVHLFQGNVYQPPFKPERFDMVYSDGVLHHTPDTFEAFKSVSRHVKPGGDCYISVYSNETKNPFEMIVYYLEEAARTITTRTPHSLLHFFCALVSPFYWLYTNAYNYLSGKARYTPRTLRELALSLFDGLSPRYDWHHTTPEVMKWFETLGYENIRKTVENQNGIGVAGMRRNVE